MVADKFGQVSCEMEAAGQSESWDVEYHSAQGAIDTANYHVAGFSFKNYWGSYLSQDAEGLSEGLRSDAQVAGPFQIFQLRIQAQNRTSVKKPLIIAGVIERDLEKEYWSLDSFKDKIHTWDKADVEQLEKARKEGKLREELVLRRERVKNDRNCK